MFTASICGTSASLSLRKTAGKRPDGTKRKIKDYTLMGNVAEQSFSEVYHSAQAHQVRNAPFPACYRITNEDGRSLADDLLPVIGNSVQSRATDMSVDGNGCQ